MAKETYYFSHDSNALTDTKILNMRCDYGMEGYGLYWAIIEMMRNEEDYKLELDKNTYRAIKTLTNTDIDVEEFIKNCIEDYNLFSTKGNKKFYSNSLLRRMEEKDRKSAIAREKAVKRWNSNATNMQQQCSSNANKVNKSKVNKNKIKENKEFIPPTLEDIKKYISDKELKKVNAEHFLDFFTESNWIDSKGNKVKNWKLKLLTWNNYGNENATHKKQTNYNNYEQRSYDNLNNLYANKGG